MAEPEVPPTSIPLEQTLSPVFEGFQAPGEAQAAEVPAEFRLILDYDAGPGSEARVVLAEGTTVELPEGREQRIEVLVEAPENGPALFRVWQEGKWIGKPRKLRAARSASIPFVAADSPVSLGDDFTAMVRFEAAAKGGTLFAKAMAEGKWVADAKALFIRDGRLIYDIGWKGELSGRDKVSAGKEHVAVLVSDGGKATLHLDGRLIGESRDFRSPDPEGAVFKIGEAAANFGGPFSGAIREVRVWNRALTAKETAQISSGEVSAVNTADFDWRPQEPGGRVPVLEAKAGFTLRSASLQPLAKFDHGQIVRGWGAESLKRGEAIYQQLCVTCHGTREAPGSLPTAPRFHLDDLKNGADPYRMFQTLEKGYGQMVAQAQYSTSEKYDVIHYIREHFFKGRNEDQLVAIDEAYLDRLPRGKSTSREEPKRKKVPQYLLQDFGNVLFWTLQVEPGNIAQKGIAIRVDEGPGGISKGKAWMLYDHDTMRLAACWTGDQFVDWRGIAFDGSHGTHTSIAGDKAFVFPNQPMWANPATGDFKDLRILGRDDRPYGPLPREWVRLKGVELHGDQPILRYTVGTTEIRERPRMGAGGAFERWIECGPGEGKLVLKIDAGRTHEVQLGKTPVAFGIRYGAGEPEVFSSPGDPAFKEKASSKRFAGRLTTRIEPSAETEGPWALDAFQLPEPDQNPWQSWMRVTGFDFFEGADSAAVCTWNGDVWIVDGIGQKEGELSWQRICSGLFQPLGLKIVDGVIYVGCRDMIARLRDLDGDRETDVIENFNSDHQVTEHFHEFAMGLQADDEGNFYYAKSARHAKQAVVPQHGTLLKVSADGSTTEILATGFRAANGVCLNPDGSFVVTDQEGNWNPKNRINWVAGRGTHEFYGNMWGYHEVTDDSDDKMIQPLCWITNAFDRSPGELLWVPEDSAWVPLRGSLLNLSYGAGRIYTVPFEQTPAGKQGGMCAFPIEPFPTGVMRGRFSPKDKQLYALGMFAWAGNRHQPGGFYRLRYTGEPAHQPVGLGVSPEQLEITFSDPLDAASINEAGAWQIRAWDLERTQRYGSKHFNERSWPVESAKLSEDGRTVSLKIPDLEPTWGMSVKIQVRGADGRPVQREMHQSIFSVE
ncbi:DUF6797 domain-containing protein [Haloferula sp. A504]|uniref:DUF6797 domain-containing protein n=1 Tax=Haloferula sp. A504 TaxID=3373601 RepID=UPI0031BE53D3|nr:c-type cytochrome [Verrucomicrobiaceae bacterium E54]